MTTDNVTTLTPEQLLEVADSIASRGCVIERAPLADFFRAHAAALNKNAELRADAERYRFLTEPGSPFIARDPAVCVLQFPYTQESGIDAAIDAARKP